MGTKLEQIEKILKDKSISEKMRKDLDRKKEILTNDKEVKK